MPSKLAGKSIFYKPRSKALWTRRRNWRSTLLNPSERDGICGSILNPIQKDTTIGF